MEPINYPPSVVNHETTPVKNPEISLVITFFNSICLPLALVIFWKLLLSFYHEIKSTGLNMAVFESLIFSFIIIAIPLILLTVIITYVNNSLKKNLFSEYTATTSVKFWNRFILFLLATSVIIIFYSLFAILNNGDAVAPFLLLPLFLVGGVIIISLSISLVSVNKIKS